MDRFNLGTHTRQISTYSPEAQRYFDLGLNWCYGFNHEEGVVCFKEALRHDPTCVMAHWGVAYGTGPFYNKLWRSLSEKEANEATSICHSHIQLARRHAASANEVENLLVEALSNRFQKPHAVTGEEYDQWDDDYAYSMRPVYQNFPDDHDVAALFAEALMTRTAWKLWDVKSGLPPAGADTLEAIEVIERSIRIREAASENPHPAILHLHIHATEMSNAPEQAMQSADRLVDLCPDAGHLNHMPGHTYVLCGKYAKAKEVSEKAIRADDKYVAYAGAFNFYTTARAHDLHMMMHTCMLLGQYKPALDAAENICATLTRELLSMDDYPQTIITMEGYYSMKMHVLVRFGRWQDILDEPTPRENDVYPVTIAMHHYAKTIAQAFLKNFDAAEKHRKLFYTSCNAIDEDRVFFNNPAREILSVGEAMLEGELAYHQRNYELAFSHLRDSVKRDDELEYSEPWPWMHPPRHALAALLLQQNHLDEAEEIYRTDLGLNDSLYRCAQHPDNVWSLHGLVECLERRGENTELPALKQKLNACLEYADLEISSSCMCRG